MRNINTDPLAAHFLGGFNRGAAAAKRIKNYIPLVARRRDYALQNGKRLLSRPTKPFLGGGLQARNPPNIIERAIFFHAVDEFAFIIPRIDHAAIYFFAREL